MTARALVCQLCTLATSFLVTGEARATDAKPTLAVSMGVEAGALNWKPTFYGLYQSPAGGLRVVETTRRNTSYLGGFLGLGARLPGPGVNTFLQGEVGFHASPVERVHVKGEVAEYSPGVSGQWWFVGCAAKFLLARDLILIGIQGGPALRRTRYLGEGEPRPARNQLGYYLAMDLGVALLRRPHTSMYLSLRPRLVGHEFSWFSVLWAPGATASAGGSLALDWYVW